MLDMAGGGERKLGLLLSTCTNGNSVARTIIPGYILDLYATFVRKFSGYQELSN